MNILSLDKQIEVIAALCEGVGIRTASRLTGVNRGTVGSLALRVGLGVETEQDPSHLNVWSYFRGPLQIPGPPEAKMS